jgi:hypothetical protein
MLQLDFSSYKYLAQSRISVEDASAYNVLITGTPQDKVFFDSGEYLDKWLERLGPKGGRR